MTDSQPNTPEHDPVTVGHEADLANVSGIALAIGGLSLLAVLALLIVWGITQLLSTSAEGPVAVTPPEAATQQFVGPRLSAEQPEALHELRAREAEQLASYGWVDRQAGLARLPIERAIEIVSDRGLPTWPASPQQIEPTGGVP